MKRIAQFLFMILILSSCEKEGVKMKRMYFDLNGYFKEEAHRLAQSKTGMKKLVKKNGEEETKSISTVDWEKELQPFRECDINKPALVNSYTADTSFFGASFVVKYKAKEENIPVREITIMVVRDTIEMITINRLRDNFYYTASDTYIYSREKGYTIKGGQKVRFLDEITYEVAATFTN